jgi:hypothetical protein
VRARAQPVTPLTPPRTQFGFWRLPRPMADVKNFDFMLGLADLIVDKKRAVQKFADQGPFSNHATHAGKGGWPSLPMANHTVGAPSFAAFCEGWVAELSHHGLRFHAACPRNEIFPQPSFTRTGPDSSRR